MNGGSGVLRIVRVAECFTINRHNLPWKQVGEARDPGDKALLKALGGQLRKNIREGVMGQL